MKKQHLFLYSIITIQLFFLSGCYFLDETHPSFTQLPKVGNAEITSINSVSVVFTGNIINDGGAPIKSKGICWNTSPNPTISDNKIVDETGADTFVSALTNLTTNTTYYVRAFATNKAGTSYGNTFIFTTDLSNIIIGPH